MDYSLPNRVERYRYEVLDVQRRRLGWLGGVSACRLDWSIYNTIRGSGNITVETRERRDWQRYLIRPWITVSNESGSEDTPLMTAHCRIPDEKYDDHGVTTSLEMHDRTVVLSEQLLVQTYSVLGGVKVTDAIRAVFVRLGVTGFSITDSTATLPGPRVWDPSADGEGVSWLRVVNDLCDSINYRALYPDALGNFRIEPYVEPGARSSSWRLADDSAPHDRYVGGIGLQATRFDAPNAWLLISRSTGDAAPWTAYVENTHIWHPYSIPAVGRTITDRRTDVDASSAADLMAKAEAARAEGMADQRTFTLNARYIPTVENDVIELVNAPAKLSTRASVTARSLTCGVGAKVGLTLREV